ncbi:hypothetical protein [Pseudoalteromonas sp. H105]|uniref:hypothetical protein n=1 Tax=Pseudoalteromonas sp. H105 TaxID=1348393 RepID=UPI00128F80B7|nr:hypothetical protein [Pseudoalteromonas sp. H105]
MSRSFLLSVSQQRSQQSIELRQGKALVAAKAWVSLYPNSVIISNLDGCIIHTSASNLTPQAGRFFAKDK